eukprot:g16834.t1
MLDLTREWFAVVRQLRQQQQESKAGGPSGLDAGGGYSSAAEAFVGSRWRTPLTPFMQQATELNYSIREMHTFLRQHFLDYVDVHHCLPSKRSPMTEDEKDLIDLEVTSFMTACAAGVDALKALLQRERLRRMEQGAAAAGEDGGLRLFDDGGELAGDGSGGGGGGELRAGSRPAHEHAAVTFLFERLKAVTEVAETMQAERHARAAAGKARFYTGPAESRRGPAAAAALASGAGDGAAKDRYADSTAAAAAAASAWKLTPEELEEERLLRESLPAAYGDGPADSPELPAGDDVDVAGGGAAAAAGDAAAAAADASRRPRVPSASTSAPAEAWGLAGARGAQQRPAAAEERRRRAQEGGQRGVRRTWGGQASAEAWSAEHEGLGSEEVVSAAVLEGENRDLVARMKNELDDARLVETKMSEISGLMGLFASKVVEQQEGMEHVFDAAVSANDKVVRGGQHLEKAVQRGGAFRLFYAWFMIGASFCLLFLHFYNP